jgi:glutathione peroxidase
MASLHDFTMPSIQGDPVDLSDYSDKVCLVVNVASRCGLTPQYAGLRELHDAHREQGFTVLAFPCNQFGGQEPGSDAEICEFAQSKYGADFPMFSKIEVNGDGTCDLYRFLKSGHPDEEGNEDIAWNFTKFLVGRDGRVIERYGPATTPEEIEKSLAAHL